MKIIKKVVVKQVLTENRKQCMVEEFEIQRKQIIKEIKQLEFQLHKKLKSTKNNIGYQKALQTSFQKEINDRHDKHKMIDYQIQQLQELPIGTEIRDQTINSIVEINIGDEWNPEDAELIIKDGFIIDIRNGGKEA